MRARLLWLAGILALMTLLWWMLRPRPLPVQLGAADRGRVRVLVEGEGVTRARAGAHAELSSPVTGYWSPAVLEAGDPVRRGQVLGQVAPAALDAPARLAAGARVAAAEAAWEERRTAASRADRLFTAGAVSAEAVERAHTAEVTARAELAAARAALATGEAGRPVALRAPMAGRVLRLAEPHARTVLAGTLLLEVGDPRALEAVVDLRTEDVALIGPGTTVALRTGTDDGTFAARVLEVEPSAFTKVSPLGVEEQRVNVVLGFAGPPSGVGVGWRVEATFTVAQADGVVRVPTAALVRGAEGWGVWEVVEGRARYRRVTIGRVGDGGAEVTDGLAPGAQVVLRPEDALREGRRVTAE
jgi:HlyD family secretion protein